MLIFAVLIYKRKNRKDFLYDAAAFFKWYAPLNT